MCVNFETDDFRKMGIGPGSFRKCNVGDPFRMDFSRHMGVVLLHSVALTLQRLPPTHASTWRLLDTHRQVWGSLLWGHCSFLLGPGAHKALFMPSKSLFPSHV